MPFPRGLVREPLAAAAAEHQDLEAFVRALGSQGLQAFPSAELEVGSAIWIPLGWVPVFVGVPPFVDWTKSPAELKEPRSGADQRHLVSWGMYLACAQSLLPSSTPVARKSLMATYTLAEADWPGSVKKACADFFSNVSPASIEAQRDSDAFRPE